MKKQLITLLLLLCGAWLAATAATNPFTAAQLAGINIQIDRDSYTGEVIGCNRVSMAYSGGTTRITASNFFGLGEELTFSVNWSSSTISFAPQVVYSYTNGGYTYYLYIVANSVVSNENVNTVLGTTLTGRVNSSGFTISTTWNLAVIGYDPESDSYTNLGPYYGNGLFTQILTSNATMTYDEVKFDSEDKPYNTGSQYSCPVYLYNYNNQITIYNFIDYGFVPVFTPGTDKNTWENPNQVLSSYTDSKTNVTYNFGLYNWETNDAGFCDVLTNQKALATVNSTTEFNMGNITLADPVNDGMGFIAGNARIVLNSGTLPFEEPVIPGDVNADKKVNVTDVMCVANYIVGNTPEVFIEEAADVNNSGTINITDLIAIANIAIGNSATPSLAPALLTADDALSVVGYDAATGTLTIALSNCVGYSGFQMDIDLPHGATLAGAQLTGRAGSHTLLTGTNPDGTTRLLAFSPTNAEINGTAGALLTLQLSGNATEGDNEITLSNITFGTRYEAESNLPAVTYALPAVSTGITGVAGDKTCVNVTNTQGVILRQGVNAASATQGLPAGIYIVGGKKVLVK